MNEELKNMIQQPVLLSIWENTVTHTHVTLERIEDYIGYKVFYLTGMEDKTYKNMEAYKTRQAANDRMRKIKEYKKIWSRR